MREPRCLQPAAAFVSRPDVVPGQWTEVRIPLSEANSSGKPIVNIELNDASGSTIGIDDIGLQRAK